MESWLGTILGFFGIALAVALPGIGSAIGVGLVGEAGAGVVTEDPDKFGQILLLQVIPGTQGIYGLLTGFLLMMRLNVFSFGNLKVLTLEQGLFVVMAALPIALVGWLSAISQGKTAAAGVGVIAKRPEELGKPVTFAAMVETYAVLAFLSSLLLIFGLPIK
ncbi:MAG TPA: V-type ATP synthase subunit K [Firmicutes bacterium]|nr:V-type ATP synthase subunit K [Bacillota bacterium]